MKRLVERLRILLTEGSSLSARQTLYPLGPNYDIDVLDPNPLCQCRFSSYVSRFIRSPSFAKQPVEFLRFVADLVRGGRYDVLLPTHEQTYLLSRFRDAFAPHIDLALPEFAALERLQNKAEFSRLLLELGLPQPQTTIVRTLSEFERPWRFPLYLKLAHSTAGGGVFHINDDAALRERADQLETKGMLQGKSEMLVQQPARGNLSTAQAVFNQGELIGVHCFESRRLGVGGMSTARTSVDHAIVREHVERIGKHLAWHGAFFIDYFYDGATGRPEYIEANPRIGETVNAMLAGVNLPELLVRISRGESPARAPLGRFGVRTHNSLMILMSLAYAGGSRAALVRELRQFARRGELYEHGEDELTRPRDDWMSLLPFVWTTLQLLALPPLAKRIVAKTVGDYSLPQTATEQIKSLSLDVVNGPI